MRSIRTRITLAVVGCTALTVAIAATVVALGGRKLLFDALDERLTSRARWFSMVPRMIETPRATDDAAAASGDDASRRGSREGRGFGPMPFSRGDGSSAPTFWSLTHDATDHSEVSRYGELPDGLSLATLGVKAGAPPSDVELEDGRILRVVSIATSWFAFNRNRLPESAPPGSDAIARDDRHPAITWLALDGTEVHREASRLVWLLATAWAAATLLAWLASWGVARAVLRPVAGLSQTIESLSPENLAARVPMEEVPAELSAVGTRLNALLQRVQSAFERERATIANMAHELRTPISALRTELEFAQFRADGRPADQRTIAASLALALRMQSLVNALLTMSRIESGQEVLARSEIDLVRTVRDAWGTVAARAKERGLALRYSGPEELRLLASGDHLNMVAANLLDNAVSHGSSGDVEVAVKRTADAIEFTVANRCEGDASAAGNLFEPFWRQDPARSDARHFGLGLALCDRVVRLLGGTIEAKQDGGRFCVKVTLPNAG